MPGREGGREHLSQVGASSYRGLQIEILAESIIAICEAFQVQVVLAVWVALGYIIISQFLATALADHLTQLLILSTRQDGHRTKVKVHTLNLQHTAKVLKVALQDMPKKGE